MTSLIIGESVTSIEESAFSACARLSTVVIPNSVTTIGDYAFDGCVELASLSLGTSITSIGTRAFYQSKVLTSIESKMKNPCEITEDCFSEDAFYNSSLTVPEGSLETYKATKYWKNFVFFEQKVCCATPTITYSNGKLKFECATEGVVFVPTITCASGEMSESNEIDLCSTFTVSVYAKRDGYWDSDIATLNIKMPIKGDMDEDGELSIIDVTQLVDKILQVNQ